MDEDQLETLFCDATDRFESRQKNTAVQDKTAGDVAELTTQGLRVGFWLFRGEVPHFEMMIFSVRVTTTAINWQGQRASRGAATDI